MQYMTIQKKTQKYN